MVITIKQLKNHLSKLTKKHTLSQLHTLTIESEKIYKKIPLISNLSDSK